MKKNPQMKFEEKPQVKKNPQMKKKTTNEENPRKLT